MYEIFSSKLDELLAHRKTDKLILEKLEALLFQQAQTEWLLNAILTKGTKMVADLDTFVTDMTTKMGTMEAGIASLRPFIEGLFAKIGAVPGLTDAQKAALDAIEASVDKDAAAIVAAMGPATPPVTPPAAPAA